MTATLPEMSPAWIVPPKKSSYEKKVTMRRGVKTADVGANKTNILWLLSVCLCAFGKSSSTPRQHSH